MEIDRAQRALLGKIGFMACRRAKYDEARVIFQALQQSDPSKAGPYIGLAVILMSEGKAAEAATYLKDTVPTAVRGDPDVQAYLGLAFFMNKQFAAAKEVLSPVAGSGPVGSASSMAKSILEQIK